MKTTIFIAIIIATLGWGLATAAIAATPAFAVGSGGSGCTTDPTGHNVCYGSGGGSGQGGGGSGGSAGGYTTCTVGCTGTQDIRLAGGGGSGQGGGGSGGTGALPNVICTGPNKSPEAVAGSMGAVICKNG